MSFGHGVGKRVGGITGIPPLYSPNLNLIQWLWKFVKKAGDITVFIHTQLPILYRGTV